MTYDSPSSTHYRFVYCALCGVVLKILEEYYVTLPPSAVTYIVKICRGGFFHVNALLFGSAIFAKQLRFILVPGI